MIRSIALRMSQQQQQQLQQQQPPQQQRSLAIQPGHHQTIPHIPGPAASGNFSGIQMNSNGAEKLQGFHNIHGDLKNVFDPSRKDDWKDDSNQS